ncbi:MAG: NAD-dependent epimerase/dehydratase family protein [Myxococcota bacterium]
MTRFTEPETRLEPGRAPDKVLVIGATGHIGRVFLEQGLALYPDCEFRVLLRDMARAKDFPQGVVCRPGDVRDVDSVRAACSDFTTQSLLFDSVTRIDLSARDESGRIEAINLRGVENVIRVARELGLTLHKAHSSAGIPCPKEGIITERTEVSGDEEEAVYATLPYLLAKKQATRKLLAAQADGLRVTVSYLPSPIGPRSRDDALINQLIVRYARARTYFYPEGMSLAYVDARDAAKVHWVAFMDEVHDDFILANNTSHQEFVDAFEQSTGVKLRMWLLKPGFVLFVGKALDNAKRWFAPRAALPLSEASARLMFANMSYSADKAKSILGFEPRPTRATFADQFSDLACRGLIDSRYPPEPPSIW